MKKIIIAFLVIVVLTLAAAFAWLWLNQSLIQQKAIEAVNNQIDTEIEVKGPINVSLIDNFPQVSLTLGEVYIADNLQVGDTLVYLDEILVSFNLISVIKKDYTISSIGLQGGVINAFTDANGINNFDIIKAKEDSVKNNPLLLELSDIVVKDVLFSYRNLKDKINIESDIDKTTLSTTIDGKNFNINSSLSAYFKDINIAEQSLIFGQKIDGDIYLSYNSSNDCYELTNNTININNNKFDINGSYCNTEDLLQFNAKAEGSNLNNALALISSDLIDVSSLKATGDYTIDATISGTSKVPELDIIFAVNNGSAKLDTPSLEIDQLSLKGRFNNLDKIGDQLKFDEFALSSKGSNISGSIEFPNLKELDIRLMNVKGNLEHEFLSEFIQDKFTVEKGNAQFNDLAINIKKIKTTDSWFVSRLEGAIDLEDFSGTLKQLESDYGISGTINFEGTKCSAKGLNAFIGENNIQYTGSLSEYLGYLQPNNWQQATALKLSGSLESSYFNVSDFIKEDDSETKDETEKQNSLYQWLNLDGAIDVNITEFHYDELMLQNLSMKVQPKQQGRIHANEIKAEGLEGTIKGSLQLFFSEDEDLEISLNTDLDKLNIQKLFESFNNFDQTSITSDNLRGILSAHVIFSATWEAMKTLNMDELITQADITISNGELIELQSLSALSKYLSIEQLEHLSFTELGSTITIENGQIIIPETEIKSNVLALSLEGTHSFEDEIDYSMTLNLKNLLAAKFQKEKTLDQEYINDKEGGINLFISMRGTVDDPIISLDKEKKKEKRQEDWKQEKDDLKNIFSKEDSVYEESGDYMYFEEDSTEYVDWE